jgi:hypothetical protein
MSALGLDLDVLDQAEVRLGEALELVQTIRVAARRLDELAADPEDPVAKLPLELVAGESPSPIDPGAEDTGDDDLEGDGSELDPGAGGARAENAGDDGHDGERPLERPDELPIPPPPADAEPSPAEDGPTVDPPPAAEPIRERVPSSPPAAPTVFDRARAAAPTRSRRDRILAVFEANPGRWLAKRDVLELDTTINGATFNEPMRALLDAGKLEDNGRTTTARRYRLSPRAEGPLAAASRIVLEPLARELEPEEDTGPLAVDPPADSRGSAQGRLLEALGYRTGTSEELATRLGLSEEHIIRLLARLRDEGEAETMKGITRGGKALWRSAR